MRLSIESLSKELTKVVKSQANKPKPYDTKGVVRRIEGGYAYVHFSGSGIDETPVLLTIDAHPGDEVMVRSSGGRAYLIGNQTSPPTDDTTAVRAGQAAYRARITAERAKETADQVEVIAFDAKGLANDASEKADSAVAKANSSIASDTIHYLATSYDSGVTREDSPSTYGTWSTTIQTMTAVNRYLWTYHTYHKASGQSVNTDPVITGVYGQKGANVTGIVEYYAVSATNEPPADSEFSPNVIQPTAATPYLWNMELVTFSDGTSNPMGKHILMTYNQGTEGRGIASVTEYYARNNSTTPPADSDFGTSVVLPTAQEKYVWNYEVIAYTDGLNPTVTAKRVIGTYGEKGDVGDTPTITTTKNGSTTTIYADGESIGTILDGLDGGSPIVSKSGDTVTIVDAEGNIVTVKDGANGQSIKGDDGYSAYLHIAWSNAADGSVDFSTTVAAGKQYMGTYTDDNPVDSQSPGKYKWVKTKGEKGVKGDAPVITTTKNGKTTTILADGASIGAILDGLDGGSPTVSKSGDTVTIIDAEGNVVTVKDGANGQSIKGDDGDDAYFHIAWANSADGSVDFSTTVAVGKSYMGTYTDHTQEDSQLYGSYRWVKIKGEDGTSVTILGSYATYAELIAAHPTGTLGDAYMVDGDLYVWNGLSWENVGQIQGPPGAGGVPAYVHIAWANSADGETDFSTTVSLGKQYIGTYADHTLSDSLDPDDYDWVKIKGEQGAQGNPGDDGVSVTGVQPQYHLHTSSTATQQEIDSWTWTNSLTYVTDMYIWTRDLISYSDNTSAPSEAIYNQALTVSCATSEDALRLVEGVNEHFWADETGAHVTKVSQSDWRDPQSPSYHSGGNTLFTSEGMAVRRGMTELATFMGSGTQIGMDDQCVIISPSTIKMRLIDYYGNIRDIIKFTEASGGLVRFRKAVVNGEVLQYFITTIVDEYGMRLFRGRSTTEDQEAVVLEINQGRGFVVNGISNPHDQGRLSADCLYLYTSDDNTNTSTELNMTSESLESEVVYGGVTENPVNINFKQGTIDLSGVFAKISINGKPLIKVRTVVSADDQTIAASATNSYYDQQVSIPYDSAYSGYTPMGVIDYKVTNATTSGIGSSWTHVYKCCLESGPKINWGIRNMGNIQVKIKLTARVLYVMSGIL